MTKKQQKEIAIIWSVGIIYGVGMDSFENYISEEDSGAIVEYCQQIAANLLRNRPQFYTLPEIINYVLNK